MNKKTVDEGVDEEDVPSTYQNSLLEDEETL